MTPVKNHCIRIYDNQISFKIGEEIHIVYVKEAARALAKGERLSLYYDGWIYVNNIECFEPNVRSLVEKTKLYSKGDRLSVNPEMVYIEDCLTRIFKCALCKEEIQQKITDNLHLLKGAVFYLNTSMTRPYSIELPDFPTKEPNVLFSPAEPESFHFPEPETERKSKKIKVK